MARGINLYRGTVKSLAYGGPAMTIPEQAVVLLPCPFCGSDAGISEGDGRFYAHCNSVECFCCIGEAYDRDAMPNHIFYEADAAAAAWNKRACLLVGVQRPEDVARALATQMNLKTTPAMRDRLRELTKKDGIDDYDRAVMLLLDDFASCMVMLAVLALPHTGKPQEEESEDIRWAINYLLEKIAAKFEANDTWDIWRSDAAALVRSFKHDLSAPSPPVAESGWQEIETDKDDGNFHFYGLTVRNTAGHSWFEVYYLARDGVDGSLLETSGDVFSTWQYDDFEVWSPAPQPPAPPHIAEEQTP